MKKAMIFLLVMLFVIFMGCEVKQTFKNQDGKILIGYISESMTVQRWIRDRDIFVAKAEALGAQVIVQNAYEDSERQKEIGIEMIKQGVDVLVIVPWDKDTLSDLVRYAHANNVKIISYDRLIRDANVDLYISFDNFQVGYLMAKSAVTDRPSGNYVIMYGPPTDYNCFMIKEGCMNALEPYIAHGSINIVGETWIDRWRDEAAYEYINGLLSNGVHIDVIISGDDQLAQGAISALSENRLAGDVYVTGQDAELAACQRIVEGTQHMTIYKPLSILAEGAAEIAVLMAAGGDSGATVTIFDGTHDVDYIIYSVIPVDKDRMVEVIIEDGFYTVEQVYQNVPHCQWPNVY